MLLAEVQMLACVSGTIFGREVVPEVWRMSATSSACAGPGRAAAPIAEPESRKRARAGLRLGVKGNEINAELLRGPERGRFAARFDDQRLGLEVFEIELELVLPIGGIERRRGRCGRHAQKRRRHFRSVRQHDGDPVAAADSEVVQRAPTAIDQSAQSAIGQRRRLMRGDGDRVVMARCDEASQGAIRVHVPIHSEMRYRVSDSPPPALRTMVSSSSLVTA